MQTNWCVLTGGFSCGKSTTLDRLKFMGFNTTPEPARVFYDNEMSKGKSREEIAADFPRVQKSILDMHIDLENRTNPSELTFFDKSILDVIIYSRHFGQETVIPDNFVERRYRKVFLLDPLDYVNDSVRTESQRDSEAVSNLSEKVYGDYGYDIIKVPRMSVEERCKFILGKVIDDDIKFSSSL